MINRFPPRFQFLLTSLKYILLHGGYAVKSYAQEGEDLILNSKLFLNQKKGFYVDVGACHPLQGSNTHLFYKKGWNGINIEPNPQMKKYFTFFRSRDINLTAGVSDKNGTMDYYMFAGPGVNTFDPEQIKRKEGKVPFLGKVSVPVYTLKSIFEKYKVTTIDLLSVDAENLDLEVLASNDWSRWKPRAIIVEDNNFNPAKLNESAVYNFLIEKGYRLYSTALQNLIFVRA